MKVAPLIMMVFLLIPSVLAAIDFDSGLSQDEEQQVDAILSPVMKIYNFLKYGATVAGVVVLAIAGITFVTAGGEVAKKEKAKAMAIGVVVGLIVIWVAPLVVRFIFT